MLIRNKREVGFSLCRLPSGQLTHGPIVTGTPNSVNVPVQCPKGSTFEGIFHTHPSGIAKPSETDVRSAKQVGAKVLCIQDDNTIRCFRVVRRR